MDKEAEVKPQKVQTTLAKALIFPDTNEGFLTWCMKSEEHENYLFLKECYSLFDDYKNHKDHQKHKEHKESFFFKSIHHKIKKICEVYIIPSTNDNLLISVKGKKTVNLDSRLRDPLIRLYLAKEPNPKNLLEILQRAVGSIENLLYSTALNYLRNQQLHPDAHIMACPRIGH